MQLIKHTLFLIVLGWSLFACKKAELPITPPDKGNVQTATISMTSNYKYQVYFDFSSNSNVGQNSKTEWDIGVSNKEGSTDIILNTSKMMFVAAITDKTFSEIQDTTGFGIHKTTDESRGQTVDLAFTGNDLFIVDKGMNENGIHLGYFKIQLIENGSNSFTIRCANLDGSNEEAKSLIKNGAYNFTFINWNNGIHEVLIEPQKSKWDVVFTQYTYMFYEPEFTPYLVTGCLLNSNNTQAIEVTNLPFESVDLNFAESQFFPNKRDAIGYEWKYFNGSIYSVDSERIYIVKDQEGYYYKLRFIDFYDENGDKGSPQFEYQQL